jgi:hypothetical protein
MGVVPVTINGVMFPKGKSASDKPVPCTIVGYAWVTGLGVGGGPIMPDPLPPGTPEHPIVLPPASPGEPTHPIVLPEPPVVPPDPPTDPGMVKPPPPNGGWGWHPDYGWGYFPGPGQPGPKR